MEKVKITQEQADAIELTRRTNTNAYIVKKKFEHGDDFRTIPNIDADSLIRALYIGYEVEQTPEEKVRSLFKTIAKNDAHRDHPDVRTEVIIEILDILNIKIEGVNT